MAYVEQDRTVKLTGAQYDPPWGPDRIDETASQWSGTYCGAAPTNAYPPSHASAGKRTVPVS